ncbi:hypothetical protein BaRGS_00035432 [Batillaria attramentaria]|uniref:Ig-like domain-containing protein n=1 Tax=Batillaria attramentaria TaxID=370345 RepID=A0ABD0JEH8_9CAEN
METFLGAVVILLVAFNMKAHCQSATCGLTLEPDTTPLTISPGSNVSLLCDATCLGPLSRDQLQWRDPLGRRIPMMGAGRMFAVNYNRWMMSRLVLLHAGLGDSGVYTCEVRHGGRHLQYAAVVYVEDNYKEDPGPRRGDIYIEPEPEFGNVRPVRSARRDLEPGLPSNAQEHPALRGNPVERPHPRNDANGKLGYQGEHGKHGYVDESSPRVGDIVVDVKSIENEFAGYESRDTASDEGLPDQFEFFWQGPQSEDQAFLSHSREDADEPEARFRRQATNESSGSGPNDNTTALASFNASESLTLLGDNMTLPGFNDTTIPTDTIVQPESTTAEPLDSTDQTGSGDGIDMGAPSSPAGPGGGSQKPGTQGKVSSASTDPEVDPDFGRYGLVAFALALSAAFLLLVALLLVILCPRFFGNRRQKHIINTSDGERQPTRSSRGDGDGAFLMGEVSHKPVAPMASATGLNGEYHTSIDLDTPAADRKDKGQGQGQAGAAQKPAEEAEST